MGRQHDLREQRHRGPVVRLGARHWLGRPLTNDAYVPCVVRPIPAHGAPADGFVPLVPARLLDTRAGQPTIDCRFSGSGSHRRGGRIAARGRRSRRRAARCDRRRVERDRHRRRRRRLHLGVPVRLAQTVRVQPELPDRRDRAERGHRHHRRGRQGVLVQQRQRASDRRRQRLLHGASSFVPGGPGRAYDSRVLGPRVPASTVGLAGGRRAAARRESSTSPSPSR